MAKSDNIYLVGLMGSGKTTVGKQLARQLGVTFMDADQELERRTGATIPLIFELEGEAGFRRREEKLLHELTDLNGIVLATGGGAILSAATRERLRANGTVVYLRAEPHALYERTRMDRNRPLLQTEDPLGRLEALLEARGPLYTEVADLILDTGHSSLHHLIDELLNRLGRKAIPNHD